MSKTFDQTAEAVDIALSGDEAMQSYKERVQAGRMLIGLILAIVLIVVLVALFGLPMLTMIGLIATLVMFILLIAYATGF